MRPLLDFFSIPNRTLLPAGRGSRQTLPTRMGRVPLLLPLSFLLFLLTSLSGCSGEGVSRILKTREYFRVTSSTANLRIAPTTLATKVKVLHRGEGGEVIGTTPQKDRIGSHNEYWYQVRLESGVEGWLYGSGISTGGSAGADVRETSLGARKIQKEIVGQWWEVHPDGSHGRARIFFWPDGSYKQGLSRNSMREGKYTVEAQQNGVRLIQGSMAGNRLMLFRAGDELRLMGKRGYQEILFKRKSANPDEEDPLLREQEQSPAPGKKGETDGSGAFQIPETTTVQPENSADTGDLTAEEEPSAPPSRPLTPPGEGEQEESPAPVEQTSGGEADQTIAPAGGEAAAREG